MTTTFKATLSLALVATAATAILTSANAQETSAAPLIDVSREAATLTIDMSDRLSVNIADQLVIREGQLMSAAQPTAPSFDRSFRMAQLTSAPVWTDTVQTTEER